jgi:hypothetical protein
VMSQDIGMGRTCNVQVRPTLCGVAGRISPGVDDGDVEVLDEQDDVGSGVGSAVADVAEAAGDAQGDARTGARST